MKSMLHRHKASSSAIKSLTMAACSAFTIIELVIVVGIMAVLLAISLPTVKSIRLTAEKKKAAIQATLLTQAVIKYKQVYGFWPGQLAVKSVDADGDAELELRPAFRNASGIPIIISRYRNTDFEPVGSQGIELIYFDQNDLYRALNTIDPENKEGGLYRSNPLNPKQIDFIDLENEQNAASVAFTDPWGQEFIVMMGLNPQTAFTHTININNGPSYRITVSNNIAFAFSRGPDGNLSTNYIFSAGVK